MLMRDNFEENSAILKRLAEDYNDMRYFECDPLIFPKRFLERGASLQDVEIAAVVSAHLAWGRRDLIVRDCNRAFDEMGWRPYEYVMSGKYRAGKESLHRTVTWNDFCRICGNMKSFYEKECTLEVLGADGMRELIYGQKPDPNAANKKIHMMRRWMVRNDGKVDLGIWKNTSPADLIIPVDVHVHRSAFNMGITERKSVDRRTALEITDYLKRVFPEDPCLGDFALFAYAAVNRAGIR